MRAEAVADQTGGLGGGIAKPLEWPRCPWGLGVELHYDKQPHWVGDEVSPQSFGHAGASGSLVWADPVADVAWAMLATRTFERWWRRWPSISAALLAAQPRQPA